MRKTKVLHADKIGSVNENLPSHFRSIYSDLDNSVGEGKEDKKIRYEVNENISNECLCDVNRVMKDRQESCSCSQTRKRRPCVLILL